MTTKKTTPRVTAETMAAKQRDISVSEFFAKNRHLLGFDNPRKALLTTVKEAVDNSLDACEEAGILPDIVVVIEDLDETAKWPNGQMAKSEEGKEGKKAAKSSKYRVTIVDNGPGIVRKQVEHIFGRLLYGSKFHRLKMSRGQQGIGISAAGMYGLLTTGKPMVIHTRPDTKKPAHHIELAMNTKTNRAEVTTDDETEDFPPARLRQSAKGAREAGFMAADVFATGTSVSIELEGRYQKGRGSVDEFLELTAIANPHAKITFVPPSKVSEEEEADVVERKRGQTMLADAAPVPAPVVEQVVTTEKDGVILFPRGVNELPPETKEIQPHPKGVELGMLIQMLKDFEHENKGGGTLYNFLQEKFSRVSAATASTLCSKLKDVTSRTKVSDIDHAKAEQLYREIQEAKLPPPPTDCLAPIGVRQLLAGMLKGVRAEFYAASSREADVYRGRPFQIEAAVAFGGELAAEDSARVIRFANRVPLLFQQSACSSFKAVVETSWKNYGLQQPKGSLPSGPLVIMIHMASVWVPFTSESKEAIADYDEIRKEMKLALMECGRKLNTYINKRAKMRREAERRDVFQKYIGEISQAAAAITGVDAKKVYESLLAQAKKKTAIADMELDEDGKRKKEEDEGPEEGVIVIDAGVTPGGTAAAKPEVRGDGAPPMGVSKAEAAKVKVHSLPDEDEKPKKKASKPAAPPPPAAKPATKSEAKPAKGEKPRMRMVNGKLVPVEDQQKLF